MEGHLCFAPALALENSGFPASAFERLALLEERNFWFCARNRIVIWALAKYFPRAESYFEIGCGTGFVLSAIEAKFPSLQISASEIYLQGLSVAKRRIHRCQLFQMDAREIPFENAFDVIGAYDVLEHVEEDEQVLTQILRALKPGGGVLFTVPQHRFLWSIADEYAGHKRRYEAESFRSKLSAIGFKVKRLTSFVSFILPMMALSRLTMPRSLEKYDPDSEFKLNPAINSILEKVLDLELYCIRHGINFPAGGSLLVVAEKSI